MNLDSYGGIHSYRAYWAVYRLVYWRVLEYMIADSLLAGIEVSNLAEKILNGVNHGGVFSERHRSPTPFLACVPAPRRIEEVRCRTTPNPNKFCAKG